MGNYLDLNGFPVLKGAGRVSKTDADEFAISEYSEFRIRQDREYLNDFDKEIKNLELKQKKTTDK